MKRGKLGQNIWDKIEDYEYVIKVHILKVVGVCEEYNSNGTLKNIWKLKTRF